MVYAMFSASLLLAIGAVYAGAVGYLYFRQERLLFEPVPLPADELAAQRAIATNMTAMTRPQ